MKTALTCSRRIWSMSVAISAAVASAAIEIPNGARISTP